MTELLDAPSLSPRLTWRRDHNLRVTECQHVNSLNRGGERFLCHNPAQTRWASGPTKDAAEAAFAERYGIAWWKRGSWDAAMDDIRIVHAGSPVSSGLLPLLLAPREEWGVEPEGEL